MANYRGDRIAEMMKQVIDQVIRSDVDDPRLAGTFSITHVDVTRDMRYAKVYVSVLEPEHKIPVMTALKSAAGFIRKALTGRISIRYTPELLFVSDENIAYGVHISQLLKDVGADKIPPPAENEND